MRTRLTTASLISLIATVAMMAGLVLPVAAEDERSIPGMGGMLHGTRVLAVHHGPIAVTLVDEGSDGHQLGDLRVASVDTTDAQRRALGRLDATLTTVAVDSPAMGDEIRTSTLVFSFGEGGQDQVVVTGSAAYPAQEGTIATGERTTRAIVGGAGRFSGASGSASTEHLEDDTWIHQLWLEPRADRPAMVPGRGHGRGHGRGLVPRLGSRILELWQVCGREHQGRGNAWGHRDGARVRCALPFAPGTSSEGAWGMTPGEAVATPTSPPAPVGTQVSPAPASAPPEVIVRSDLGIAEPGTAPGQELGLWQYLIPAGSELAPHTHAGWQLAHIAAGELEYTVIAGEGILLRADGRREPMGPGTYTLETGDGVVESPDLQHFGANRGPADVIILAATLYEAGAPLSIPLEVAE